MTGLTNLQVLDVRGNPLTQIPTEILQLPNLHMLYVSDYLSTKLPKEFERVIGTFGYATYNYTSNQYEL